MIEVPPPTPTPPKAVGAGGVGADASPALPDPPAVPEPPMSPVAAGSEMEKSGDQAGKEGFGGETEGDAGGAEVRKKSDELPATPDESEPGAAPAVPNPPSGEGAVTAISASEEVPTAPKAPARGSSSKARGASSKVIAGTSSRATTGSADKDGFFPPAEHVFADVLRDSFARADHELSPFL